MLKLTQDSLRNAIARAKQIRPSVKWLGNRSYAVTGSKGDIYTVHFAVTRDYQGKQVLLGTCNCAAGQNEIPCYHLAASSAVNIAVQSMRRAA